MRETPEPVNNLTGREEQVMQNYDPSYRESLASTATMQSRNTEVLQPFQGGHLSINTHATYKTTKTDDSKDMEKYDTKLNQIYSGQGTKNFNPTGIEPMRSNDAVNQREKQKHDFNDVRNLQDQEEKMEQQIIDVKGRLFKLKVLTGVLAIFAIALLCVGLVL